MAKTFDNISESSATNYLFLFAQRTLALQNEPPTPPPLNALGLPCNAISLLWTWRKEKTVVKEAGEALPPRRWEALKAGEVAAAAAAGEEASETREVRSDNASAKLKDTAAKAAADKARLSTGSVSSEEVETAPVVLEEAVAVEAVTVETASGAAWVEEEEEEAGEINVTEKWVTDNFHADDTSVEEGGVQEETEAAETPEVSEVREAEAAAETAAETETPVLLDVALAEAAEKVDKEGEDKGKTFAEKIEPLAKKITEYILDHQDDAAQEDRWRTTMKRETMKCFREQREASEKSFRAQREASGNQLDSRFDRQREEVQAIMAEVKAEFKAEVKAEVKAGVQKVVMEMQHLCDEAHSKMNEKMDQLAKIIANKEGVAMSAI
jgi:hypothetical protein